MEKIEVRYSHEEAARRLSKWAESINGKGRATVRVSRLKRGKRG